MTQDIPEFAAATTVNELIISCRKEDGTYVLRMDPAKLTAKKSGLAIRLLGNNQGAKELYERTVCWAKGGLKMQEIYDDMLVYARQLHLLAVDHK